ncbi:GTP cyclohydrolase 1 type 2 homolog [Georgfuchsia toluolica]|uniref:GTP cyclohydrolase 1 type 2 homolog n=1 Tax=Georgfuchsia toluolica TaxID=424218 RepID=A0A916J5R3_9PROT|nr:Nif3-like dinuclear metal center hexameric protein [Georgfuchsia toluolica]CAG4883948.1 GTP cyclohydrolase 1 type 2 homolog [Georgfuchsia toluolica]
MHRDALRDYLDELLQVAQFHDYCPNGLQVEGRAEIRKIICGVTASQALLDAAVNADADAVLVHHGYFWKDDDNRVTGIRKSRLATLLKRDINLFAYHLPLDAHAELGNNAQLAALAGWTAEGRFGDQDIGFIGRPDTLCTAGDVLAQIEATLCRTALLVGDAQRKVKRIAWCSGGAQGHFEEAIAAGADLYVSGEISEQTTHLARESGVPYIAAGHHATERHGIQALGAHLTKRFGLACDFVDIDNPV